jgi:hypothetical protein
MGPLLTDPPTQLGVFAAFLNSIAVPVLFAKDSKLAQTIFPAHPDLPFEA